ncbi:MAG: insulinase family protein [Bacteriovoracaceae bacterium]|nr:insulinase family protein [Bacteriovoracaceae bacterium]
MKKFTACLWSVGFVINLVFVQNSHAFIFGDSLVEKYDWNGVEVIWVKDDRFPTYHISVYFADGALSDGKRRSGETSFMFGLLDSGTNRYTQKQIIDGLEYYGASYGASVTHEYTTYHISGLIRDIDPTVRMVCQLFKDATFPKNEFKKYKRRYLASFKQMVNDHSALANRAFRKISLDGSPFDKPVEGLRGHVRKISRKDLKKKLSYFNNKVKKRIYLIGPKKVLDIENIIKNDCNWTEGADFHREVNYKMAVKKKPPIYLVTVPEAQKVEIRIGRFLKDNEIGRPALREFSSSYLGGGFTSKLMEELRKKHGLVYSVHAFAAEQKSYGRAAVSTSTKRKETVRVIELVKSILSDAGGGKISDKDFNRSKSHLIGRYPFRFEKSASYLNHLIFLDHIGKDYDEIHKFGKKIGNISSKGLAVDINDIFGWEKQVIVVLGHKSAAKILKKIGKVKIVDYRKFL